MLDNKETTDIAFTTKTAIELTDSQIELLKSIGNHYFTSSDEFYTLPYWFRLIEGNKFEMILFDIREPENI